MMKFLAIIVAFVVITGSQASDDESRIPRVEELLRYWFGLPTASDFIWDNFSESKTGQELSGLFHNASQQFHKFDREIPSEFTEPLHLVSAVYTGVMLKAYSAVTELRDQQNLQEPLINLLAYYVEPVLERMEPYFESFGPMLNDELRYIHEKLPEYFKPLDDGLFFYLKKLEDAKPTLQAIADQTLTRFRQGLEALHKNLNPYLKPLLEESKKHETEFRDWVHASIFPSDS
ncbi:uncharacterized protein LOC110089460 [Pogona vitticeps]